MSVKREKHVKQTLSSPPYHHAGCTAACGLQDLLQNCAAVARKAANITRPDPALSGPGPRVALQWCNGRGLHVLPFYHWLSREISFTLKTLYI